MDESSFARSFRFICCRFVFGPFFALQYYQHVALFAWSTIVYNVRFLVCVGCVCVCVWWDWTQIHWNEKDEEPKVTTNCRGNENENFTKCAINNNQVRKRVALRIAYIAGYNEVFQQEKKCVYAIFIWCVLLNVTFCVMRLKLQSALFSRSA